LSDQGKGNRATSPAAPLKPRKSRPSFHGKYLFGDADITVTTELAETSQNGSAASILFWGKPDLSDVYLLSVSPLGYVRVAHRVNDQAADQFSGTPPAGGGLVGLSMLAPQTGTSSWQFSKFRVVAAGSKVRGQ
jgi:hypothetical protein